MMNEVEQENLVEENIKQDYKNAQECEILK